MKVKLTQTQLEGLHILLNVALKTNPPIDMASKLLFEIVDGINDKIAAKMKKLQRNPAAGYGLSLTSIESKGLYCWLGKIDARIAEDYQYETLVANNVVAQIDQVYA